MNNGVGASVLDRERLVLAAVRAEQSRIPDVLVQKIAAAAQADKKHGEQRRAEAIRRIAVELMVVEAIDAASVFVLDVDAPRQVSNTLSPEARARVERARRKRERRRGAR